MEARIRKLSLVCLCLFWTFPRHDGLQCTHHHLVTIKSPSRTHRTKQQQQQQQDATVRVLSSTQTDNHRRQSMSFWYTASTVLQASASPSPTTTNVNPDDDDDNNNEGGDAGRLASYNERKSRRDELIQEAETLRSKAKEIMAEALAMETTLLEQTSKRQQGKVEETDRIIQTLFAPIPSSSSSTSTSSSSQVDKDKVDGKDLGNDTKESGAVGPVMSPLSPPQTTAGSRVIADRLQTGRYSQQQILHVVERLYELQDFALWQRDYPQSEQGYGRIVGPPWTGRGLTSISTTKTSQPPSDAIDGTVVAAAAAAAYGRYAEMVDELVYAATLLDDQVAASTNIDNNEGSTDPMREEGTAAGAASGYGARTGRVASQDTTTITTGGRLEKAIVSRVKELRMIQDANLNRRMVAEINQMVASSSKRPERSGSGSPVDSNNGESASGSNNRTGDVADKMGNTFVPVWVPSPFLPYIGALHDPTVGPKEVESIKNDVLLGSRFYLTSIESIPGAAVFRGNVRNSLGGVPVTTSRGKNVIEYDKNNTARVFADIQDRLQKKDGLGEKVQLFIMPDLQEGSTRNLRDAREEYKEPKPVILALSKALSPDESKLKKSWLSKTIKALCYPLTALSMFTYSLSAYALNPTFLDTLVNRRDLSALYSCLPLALGTIAVQTIHETSHYLVAKRKKIKIGLPVPIPSFHPTSFPFFGFITPLRSFPTNRAAMLDFALSGPMSALAVSLCLVVGGILLTTRASALHIARFPVVSVANMKSSFLLGSILSWLAPKTMMLPLAQPIPMHPCYVVGASGLISSALNLLPIFRLDGGRACFAAMGQRQGAIISVFTLLLTLSMAMSGASSIFLTWTLLVATLQRRQEIPPQDDVTEVDNKRLLVWFLSFLLSISILVPFPGFSLLAT